MHEETKKLLGRIGATRPVAAPLALRVDQLSNAALSFAQCGEDLLVRKILKGKIQAGESGTYVDIGCNHPSHISNTYLFYCHGWRGVCVDADARLTGDWAQVRPEDRFINAAVGEEEGPALLYRHKFNTGMHRLSTSIIPVDADFDQTPETVPMLRLETILEQHLERPSIDLMSIDVEGAELGVLRSNDWRRYRPALILMECDTFAWSDPAGEPTVAFLLARGYGLDCKVSTNILLRAVESGRPATAAPPRGRKRARRG